MYLLSTAQNSRGFTERMGLRRTSQRTARGPSSPSARLVQLRSRAQQRRGNAKSANLEKSPKGSMELDGINADILYKDSSRASDTAPICNPMPIVYQDFEGLPYHHFGEVCIYDIELLGAFRRSDHTGRSQSFQEN